MTHPLYPCLWFDGQAKEAAEFYCSIFPDSKIVEENPVVVLFELNGRTVMGLNGGPEFAFTEAVSLVIPCDTQQEIDHYWARLSAGGSESQCGWLKDRYGLSWQVVPSRLGEWMRDPVRGQRVMQALMLMTKLDIHVLMNA
ncbi:MAG: VOC family protein [Cytophagales bacterium]|nr:VOC family protein [Cytophagales bacterium]